MLVYMLAHINILFDLRLLDVLLLYYYYSQALDKCKYYILCTFYTWFALPETSSLPRACGFAKGQISGTRQRGSLPRASPRSPRQRQALGKINLCRGPSPRQIGPCQIWPDGSRRPLASVFAEYPPSGTRQRFFIFFLNFFCREPLAKPSAKIPFAEGQARPSAKIFYFFGFLNPVFLWCYNTLFKT